MPPMKCATNADDAHTQHFLQVANLQLDGAKQPRNDPDCQPAGCQA